MGHISNVSNVGFQEQGSLAREGSFQWRGAKALEPLSHWNCSKDCDDDDRKAVRLTPPSSSEEPTFSLVLLAAAALFCFFLIPHSYAASGIGRQGELPQRITRQDAGDLITDIPSPSLRGCCGEPTEFRWIFLDQEDQAEAGRPFRTRLLARDRLGRQARPSACDALRVGLDLSGRARLSSDTLPSAWRRSELELYIENELAEVVRAQVRIQSPDPEADVLLHTSQIRFAPGPMHGFSLRVELSSDSGGGTVGGSWQTSVPLSVIASIQDRFGNPTTLNPQILGGGKLLLRSNAAKGALEIKPEDGTMFLDRSGEARAVIRGLSPGSVEVWLEQVGGNAPPGHMQELRARTAHSLSFASNFASNSASAHAAAPRVVKASPRAEFEAARTGISDADANWLAKADEVREAFRWAWKGYKTNAWGFDELQPVSRKGRDSFGGVGLTILDSMSTIWLMGLDDEFEEAAAFVRDTLDFAKADSDVSVFELTIRGVGGLLGAHTLSGQQVFLDKAKELGERLLPAFDTPSRLPLPRLNIARGRGPSSGEPTILSEAGSCQLEFRSLSARTGDRRFQKAADDAFEAIQSSGLKGLLPVYLTPTMVSPVKAVASKFAFGALADSYYEYLLKQWLQSPSETRFKDSFLQVMDELPSIIRPLPDSAEQRKAQGETKFKLIEVSPSGDPIWKMDHLSCFAPALIALGLDKLPQADLLKSGRNHTWTRLAEGLTASCFEMWSSTPTGLAPEYVMVNPSPPHNFMQTPPDGRHSFLRPETAESLFYLHRLTGDEKYRKWGEQMFNAIVKHAQVDTGGFSSIRDVKTLPISRLDEMQSFLMAETFKYLFLLFSPPKTLDMKRFVLNTEGHPFPRNEL
ncbi:unnamed protein product [Polarella glacialis]|uniref:alpha-1,2-Mannosidase n=1 Tax=Polarella glacialis TaxID=89957 RepID=A0A813G203_POLGL|nr:unnamed protein product [Polarella glacialis]